MANLASDRSLNQSMNSALKHYSSLFFLPPFKKALGWVALLCVGVVGFSTFSLFRSFDWLALSLLLGVSLFATNLFFYYVLSNAVLRRDPVFTIRRTVGLTLFCWVLWLPFIVLGVIFGSVFGLWLWIRFCLLGFCVVLTLRAVVFFAVSSAGTVRASFASPFLPFCFFVV